MSGDLLLRAADAPGILTGWTGPVIGETQGLGFMEAVYCDAVGRTWVPDDDTLQCVSGEDAAHIYLDLARAECADRAARWLAEQVRLDVGPTAPSWRRVPPDAETPDDRLWLLTARSFGRTFSATYKLCLVPTLATLDPTDPRTLPCGARWVDRRALLLCCEHVGRQP